MGSRAPILDGPRPRAPVPPGAAGSPAQHDAYNGSQMRLLADQVQGKVASRLEYGLAAPGGSMEQQHDPVGGPVDVAALVDYQQGAIVSRTLVKNKAGTVTAFAVDTGQALSEHTAPFDALLHVVEGRARLAIGATTHEVDGGQIVRLPAHTPHSVAADHRFKMLLVMIRS